MLSFGFPASSCPDTESNPLEVALDWPVPAPPCPAFFGSAQHHHPCAIVPRTLSSGLPRCRHEARRGPPTVAANAEAHTALCSSAFHMCTSIFRLSIPPDRPNRVPTEGRRARRKRHLRRPPRCHSQVCASAGLAQPPLTAFVRQTKYLGIPYAHSPTGALRFRPPTPYTESEPTDGTSHLVRPAYAFGPSCPQSTPVPYSISEDCLTVNVWVPDVPRALQSSLGEDIARGLPVLVWICASIS